MVGLIHGQLLRFATASLWFSAVKRYKSYVFWEALRSCIRLQLDVMEEGSKRVRS